MLILILHIPYLTPSLRYMKKVIFHNFSFPYASVAPGFFDIDQAGLFFAEPGDTVLTRLPVPQSYYNYAKKIGLLRNDVCFQDFGCTDNNVDSPFYQTEQIAKIKRILKTKHFEFDCFVCSELEHRLCRELGIANMIDFKINSKYDNKSNFKKLLKSNNISTPRGKEGIVSEFSLASNALWLFLNGIKRLILKPDNGFSGLGFRIFDINLLLSQILQHNLFTKRENNQSYVLEEWHDAVIEAPSVQFFISENKRVDFVSAHLQYFINGVTYAGCYSAHYLSTSTRNKIITEGKEICTFLAEQGCRGHVGLNAIVNKDRSLLWLELNARRVMSSYPNQVIDRLFQNNEGIYYHTVTLARSFWKSKVLDEVFPSLYPILYHDGHCRGVIPLHYNLLYSRGEITFLCFGRNTEELDFVTRGLYAI